MFGVLALNLAFFVSEAADRQTDGVGESSEYHMCVCVWEEGVSEISVSVRKGL